MSVWGEYYALSFLMESINNLFSSPPYIQL
jgi:hypothetical protein